MQIQNLVVLFGIVAILAVEVSGLPAPTPDVSVENLLLLVF